MIVEPKFISFNQSDPVTTIKKKYKSQEHPHVTFLLTAASQLCAVTIVDTDDANCDGLTLVSPSSVHKTIDYLVQAKLFI